MPDISYECHEAVTSYRLIPDPNAPPGEGFKHGAALQWRDGNGPWNDTWTVAPEAMEALGHALLMAARDVKA